MNPGDSLVRFLLAVLVVTIVLLVVGGASAWLFTALKKPARKKPAPSQRSELVELFRLQRERGTKSLLVEAGGRLYRHRSELSVNQVDQLSVLLGELMAWLGKPELAQRAARAQSAQVSPQPQESTSAVVPASLPQGDGKSLLLHPLEALVGAVATDVPRSIAEPQSIAAQIDGILQDQLKQAGLEERQVRLVELPAGGVAVSVGLEQYGSVEAVPDAQVRSLIRAAVVRWEKQAAA